MFFALPYTEEFQSIIVNWKLEIKLKFKRKMKRVIITNSQQQCELERKWKLFQRKISSLFFNDDSISRLFFQFSFGFLFLCATCNCIFDFAVNMIDKGIAISATFLNWITVIKLDRHRYEKKEEMHEDVMQAKKNKK